MENDLIVGKIEQLSTNQILTFTASNYELVVNLNGVEFHKDGKVFWGGRLIEGDEEFKAAIMHIHKFLASK